MKNRFLLDQMLDTDVANALNQQGFSAVRVSSLGMARSADDDFRNKLVIISQGGVRRIHTGRL